MEETENDTFFIGHSPKKRPRSESGMQDNECVCCVICLKKGGELVNPKERGLATLHKTIRSLNESLYNEHKASGILDEEGFLKPVKYHRICYQNYTSKNNQSYRQNIDLNQSDSTDTHDYLTRSGAVPMDASKCLFCSCLKKRGDRNLVQISTFHIQDTIRNAAKELEDQNLLAKVLGNYLIALEAKYHKNCLAEILTKAKRKATKPEAAETETSLFDKGFRSLISETEDDFFQGAAFTTSFLLSKYKMQLKDLGYCDYQSHRFERLKKRLQDHFQDKMVIHQTKAANEPDLIYCSQIDLQTVINKIANLKKQARLEAIENDLELPEEESQNTNLFYTALALRSAQREAKGSDMKSKITSEDICIENMKKIVPETLFTFLSVLMFGRNPELSHCDPDIERTVLAVAQDIIFSATNSRCKTPKHVGLAVSVKHITGSKVVLRLLNSLGHSIGYDDVHLLDTAIATRVISSLAEEGDAFLPTNISPGFFSHCAADNIDINEETRSGKGTTHVLGSVLYQEQENVDIAVQYRQERPRRRMHALRNASELNILDCPNKYKAHTAPSHLLHKVNINSWFQVQGKMLTTDRRYVLARLCPTKIYEIDIKPLDPNEQNVPSWKDFHAVLQYKSDQQPLKNYNWLQPNYKRNTN